MKTITYRNSHNDLQISAYSSRNLPCQSERPASRNQYRRDAPCALLVELHWYWWHLLHFSERKDCSRRQLALASPSRVSSLTVALFFKDPYVIYNPSLCSTYTNCYTGNLWNTTICSSPTTCAANCALDGADYSGTYGITTSGSSLKLDFVTTASSGTNVGSRVYLMASDTSYQLFKPLNREFTFDVDVSNVRTLR